MLLSTYLYGVVRDLTLLNNLIEEEEKGREQTLPACVAGYLGG